MWTGRERIRCRKVKGRSRGGRGEGGRKRGKAKEKWGRGEVEKRRGRECKSCGSKVIFVSEHANPWTSAVASFISLSDPITTDRVPYSHGGLVGEAATEVVGGQPGVEVSSAATAPLGGGGDPGDCGHDAGTSGICACAASCMCVCVCVCVCVCLCYTHLCMLTKPHYASLRSVKI